jgi:hypothetical protein
MTGFFNSYEYEVLPTSQDLYSAPGFPGVYYVLVNGNLPSYMDNAIEEHITDIMWNATNVCLNVAGLIKTTEPANLTIVSSCLYMNNVNFGGIDKLTIIGGEKGLGEGKAIALNDIGKKTSLVYGVSIDAINANVTLSGENWFVDFDARVESFTQIGYGFVAGKFEVNSWRITFENASNLEVGEYKLQGAIIDHKGTINAKTGNIFINCTGDYDITSNLHAAGNITIMAQGVVRNYAQVVGDGLLVNASSFTNYGRVKINTWANFSLLEDFYNKKDGVIKVGNEFSIMKSIGFEYKIQLVKNEGSIGIGSGWIYAQKFQMIAPDFKKTTVSAVPDNFNCKKGKTYHACSFYRENPDSQPTPSTLSGMKDVDFFVDTLEISTSKIFTYGKVIFHHASIIYKDYELYQWGECVYGSSMPGGEFDSNPSQKLAGYGIINSYSMGYNCCDKYDRNRKVTMFTTKASPARNIAYNYNSIIEGRAGIEGITQDLLLVGDMSWNNDKQTSSLIGNSKELVVYDPNAGKALSDIVEKQRSAHSVFWQALVRGNLPFTVDVSPLSPYVNPNLYVLNIKPDTISRNEIFMVTKREDLLYNTGTNVPVIYGGATNYFEELVIPFLFREREAEAQKIKLRLLGDRSYLEKLFKDRIFLEIGSIAKLDMNRLAEILLTNALDPSYGEVWMAEARGDEFELGKPLTQSQIDALSLPIAWFVSQENCLNTGESCLIPRIYFTPESIKNFRPQGGMMSDGDIDFEILGDVIVGPTNMIYGNNVMLNIKENGLFLGRLEAGSLQLVSGGSVLLNEVSVKGDLVFKAVNAVLINQIEAKGHVTIEVIESLAIATLVAVHNLGYQTTSEILAKAGIDAEGIITMSAKNIGIRGAKIIGSDVYIRAEEKVYIVPAELYFEIITYGKRYYRRYQQMLMHDSTILASGNSTGNATNATDVSDVSKPSGILEVFGGSGIGMKGGEYKAHGKMELISPDGEFGMEASVPWSSLGERKKHKKITSTKIKTHKVYDETPILAKLEAPEINIQTKGNQNLVGVKIVAKSCKLIAGTPEHAASIAILPATKISQIEIHTVTKGFTFKFENNGFTYAEVKKQGRATNDMTSIPSLLQIENEFYIEAVGGDYIHVQPQFLPDPDNPGKLKGTINAENINLTSAPSIHTEYSYFNRLGCGIGFSSKKGEYALKAAISFEDNERSHTRISHETPMIFGGFLQFNASQGIYSQGILLHAHELQMNSQIQVLGVSTEVETSESTKLFLEGGVKLGIKSSFASLKNTGEELVDGDYKTMEGVISAAFRAWKLYIGILKFLSGGGLKAGAWLYLEGSKTNEKSETRSPHPTQIIAEKLDIVTEQFVLRGTQIHSTDVKIKAKTMEATAAEGIYWHKQSMASGSIEIPLIGIMTPELQMALGIDKANQKRMLNTNIYVSNRLTLDIELKATMQGITIEAGDLQASFGDLVLESLQDIIEMEGKGINLGMGMSVLPSSIGGQLRNGKSHVVDKISSIVGREKAHIVVANALMLNGAIIANAQRDENGRYTDHGELAMKFGELFIKNIHDYDNGFTLGAGFDFASSTSFKDKTGKILPFESLEATVALHKGEGWTLATIGKGTIECTKPDGTCELDKANRDVNKAQDFDMEIDIKPIFLYYTSLRLTDFKLPKGPREFLEKTYKDLVEDFGFKQEEATEAVTEDSSNKETGDTNEKEAKQEAKPVVKESQKKVDIAAQMTRKIEDRIESIEGLSPEQKNYLKAEAQKDIKAFVNGNKETKEKILANYQSQIKKATDHLLKQDKDPITSEKTLGFFDKLFGPKRSWGVAAADPISATITWQMLTGLTAIMLGLYAVDKIQTDLGVSSKHRNDDNVLDKAKQSQKQSTTATPPPGLDPNDFEPDDLKYEDAPYHHKNSQGLKSPAPKNPIIALRNSVRYSENSVHRVGVDPNNNEFVVFMRTEGNTYHGHVRAWDKLTHEQQRVLIRSNLVKNNGKILGV